MLRYKIDVAEALERVGFGIYDAKKTGFISQDTFRKFCSGDTRVTLSALNKLCVLLDMDLKDVIRFDMSDEETCERETVLSRPRARSSRKIPAPPPKGDN